MIPAERRYRDDYQFKGLVDTLYAMISRLDFTPTEIREAAMLAQIKYELDHPRPFVVSRDLAETLKMAVIPMCEKCHGFSAVRKRDDGREICDVCWKARSAEKESK